MDTRGYCETYSNHISTLREFWSYYDTRISTIYLIYYHFAMPVLISLASDLPSLSVVILFTFCFSCDELKHVWNVEVIRYLKLPSLSII